MKPAAHSIEKQFPKRAGPWPLFPLALLFLVPDIGGAQEPATAPPPLVQTVREAEFRSRWLNPSVDRVSAAETATALREAAASDAAGRLRSTLHDFFKNGPLQLRGSVTVGWETATNRENRDSGRSESSFFGGLSSLAAYTRAIGPWDLDGAYSVGFRYYADPNYSGTGRGGNDLTQALRLEAGTAGLRSTLRNSFSATSGSGRDIQAGDERSRLTISDRLSLGYQLTEFTALSATVSGRHYQLSGGERATDESGTAAAAALRATYFWTGKTTLNAEAGTGYATREGVDPSTGSYLQALAGVGYVPTAKLSLGLRAGVALREVSEGRDAGGSGLRPVFQFATVWVPTEKTAASLTLELLGNDLAPQLALAVRWQPRVNTGVQVSVYQRSGFSEFDLESDELSRGVLLAVNQRLLSKIALGLSGGVELTERARDERAGGSEPYYFFAATAAWSLTPASSLETYYRISTDRGASPAGREWETRAGIQLSLTY